MPTESIPSPPSPSPAPPTRMRRQARLFRLVNVPMRLLLRLPFRTPLSRQLMLVSITGRKSGRRWQQPVSYVRDGDVLLTPGGGRWKLNLREGEPVSLRVAGRRVTARPELVSDDADVARLLGQMTAANPRLSKFVPFVGPDGEIDPDQLTQAIRYGFRIVRWYLPSAS